METPIRVSREAAIEMLYRLPMHCLLEWCEFKGEVWVAQPNVEATMRAGKPMLDLSYCMTRAINQCVLLTVQYDKRKFSSTYLRN